MHIKEAGVCNCVRVKVNLAARFGHYYLSRRSSWLWPDNQTDLQIKTDLATEAYISRKHTNYITECQYMYKVQLELLH